MSVDKNLFMYDLAVVSMMKNAAPYIKEWLDYHLIAGANHFFIYDNESTDNFKEVLQPYIDAGLVTYIFYPGKARHLFAFNDAIDNFKFFCRYMAFIDDDEFILPRSNKSIAEVVDEILDDDTIFSGLEISWMAYGSNGQEKADFSRGVLERFTYRAAQAEESVKSILNPRRVDYMWTSHFAIYFAGFERLNQFILDKYPEKFPNINFSLNDKILINHYHSKSWEEYLLKRARGDSFKLNGDKYGEEMFKSYDKNEVFDDEILRYRAGRLNALTSTGGIDLITTFAQRNQINFEKLLKRLSANLLPGFETDDTKNFFDNPVNRFEYFDVLVKFFDKISPEIFTGRLETYLTCLHLSDFLKKSYLDDELGRLFEEFSLYAIYNVCKNLQHYVLTDVQIIAREMPYILSLPYPIVNDIRFAVIKLIDSLIEGLSESIFTTEKGNPLPRWKEIRKWQHLINWLKTFDSYKHN